MLLNIKIKERFSFFCHLLCSIYLYISRQVQTTMNMNTIILMYVLYSVWILMMLDLVSSFFLFECHHSFNHKLYVDVFFLVLFKSIFLSKKKKVRSFFAYADKNRHCIKANWQCHFLFFLSLFFPLFFLSLSLLDRYIFVQKKLDVNVRYLLQIECRRYSFQYATK